MYPPAVRRRFDTGNIFTTDENPPKRNRPSRGVAVPWSRGRGRAVVPRRAASGVRARMAP